jgi:UDP-glucose 4-epimerase
MPRQTVLVTGAGGLVGSALVPALLALDHDIAVVDRDPDRLEQFAAHADSGRVRTFRVDVTDAGSIADAVAVTRPRAIVHLAALHFIPECEAQPQRTVETNIDGLTNVLTAADRAGTEFVVFASTADVYAPSAEALAEGDPARPSTVYGATKLLGERLVAEWADSGPGRRATSLRIFNVYGPADRNPHVIPDILDGLRRGGEIRVGNTEPRRDFIHVEDLAELLCRVLAAADPPAVVNAGTGLTASVAELLGILQKLVDDPFAWSSDPTKVRQVDRFCLRANTSRLRSAFPGFQPRGIETGLGDVLTALGIPVSAV